MGLELRILKEKVVEDEKNSGIGSLFDDEQTSHQHIKHLKDKYGEMRKKFEHDKDQLDMKQIEVHEQQLIKAISD